MSWLPLQGSKLARQPFDKRSRREGMRSRQIISDNGGCVEVHARTPRAELKDVAAGVLLGAILLLILAFGGVQPAWALPAYGVLWLVGIYALWRPGTGLDRLDVAVLLLLFVPLIQILLRTTADVAATQTAFLELAAAAAAFLAARRVISTVAAARALAVTGALLGSEAIAQLFLAPTYALGLFAVHNGIPMGTFVNRDDFAGCMELMLPFALFLAAQPRRGWGNLWWGLAAALMVASVVLSASRGGAIIVTLELTACGVWQLRQAQIRVAAAVGIAALLGLFVFTVGAGRLAKRFGNLGVSDAVRMHLIGSSLRMGADNPLLGVGLGAWPYVYPRYARYDDGTRPEEAHSDWAQDWAESGLVGMALLLVASATFAAEVRERLRRSPLQLAAGIAVVAFCLHAGMEFVFHIPALMLLFAVVAAMAVAGNAHQAGPRQLKGHHA